MNWSRRRFLQQTALCAPVLGSVLRAQGAGSLELGVIGAGRRGRQLAARLLELPHVSVSRLGDLKDENLDAGRAAGWRFRGTPMWTKALRTPVNTSVVAVPDHLQCRMARRSLEAGRHVFVETPLSYDRCDWNQLSRMAEERNLVIEAGYQYSHHPANPEVKRLIDSGEIGELTKVISEIRRPVYGYYESLPERALERRKWQWFKEDAPEVHPSPARLYQWGSYRDYSGGLTFHSLTVAVSLLYALQPDLKIGSVTASTTDSERESSRTLRNIKAVIRFEGGLYADLSAGIEGEQSMPLVTFEGTTGGIEYWPDKVLLFRRDEGRGDGVADPVKEIPVDDDGTRAQLRHFVQRIQTGAVSPHNLDFAERVEHLGHRIIESLGRN